MLKVQRVSRNVNGDTEVSLRMSSEESAILLTYALNELILKGLAEVEDVEDNRQLDLFEMDAKGTA